MKKSIKFCTKLLAAILTGAILTIGAAAESSGFSCEKELALPVKSPFDPKYVAVLWNTESNEDVGLPLTYGGSALLPQGKTVTLLSEKEGAELGKAQLSETVSAKYKGAVLGNTVIQPTETGLAVINAQTMETVSFRDFGAAVCSDAAIIDNLCYIAVEDGEGCRYICADMSQGLSTVWEYAANAPVSSLSAYGGFVLFTAGETLVCCDYKTGEAVENPLGITPVGNPFSGEYAVYTSADDGCVYKLRLNSDGTVEEGSLTPCQVGGELSTPVQWDGSLYVSSTNGVYIIDSLNMDIAFTLPEMKGASAPLVCYGNGTRVYVVAPFEDYMCLYSIHFEDDMESPVTAQLAKLKQFENGVFTAGENGTMYFRDDIGKLYAFAAAEYNIWLIIAKIVLFLALIVMVIILLWQLLKKRNAGRPPQY